MTSDTRIQQRRREILAAARECFEAHGYAETTVDAVAERAGLAKGTLYNYFDSKHDLFAELFAEACAPDEARLNQGLAEPGTAAEKLGRVLDHWFERIAHYQRLGRLALEFWAVAAREGKQSDFLTWFNKMYGRWRKRLVELIDAGKAEGRFQAEYDSYVAATIIMAAMDGIVVQGIIDENLHVDERLLTALKNAIIRSLSTRPEAEQTT
jgi:AcrR family transcriptional regulator